MRLHKSRYSAFPSVRPPKFHSCITSPLKQPIKSNQWFATATTKPKVKPRMTQEDAADIMQKEMFSDEIPKVPSDTLKVVIGAGKRLRWVYHTILMNIFHSLLCSQGKLHPHLH